MLTSGEIRHANFLALLEQEGGVAAMAKRLGVSESQVSQIRGRMKHSKTGEPREIGDKLARKIEAAFDLERGWLDNVHGESPDWPLPSIDPERWARLPEGVRKEIDSFALWQAERAGGAPGEESKELFASHG